MKPWPGHPLATHERPWGLGSYLFASFIIGCQALIVAGLIAAVLARFALI